jgi:hypothetical protein
MTTQSRLWDDVPISTLSNRTSPLRQYHSHGEVIVIVAERNRSIFGVSLAILVPTPVLAERCKHPLANAELWEFGGNEL